MCHWQCFLLASLSVRAADSAACRSVVITEWTSIPEEQGRVAQEVDERMCACWQCKLQTDIHLN